MSKTKLRLLTIVSLALLFALALGAAMGAIPAERSRAADAKTYDAESVFHAGVDATVEGSSAEEGETSWVQFSLKDGASVEFHRNLAFKWFEAAEEGTKSELENPGVAKYFSMSFSFPELLFERLTVAFESSEENITKDGIATNKLVFSKTSTQLGVAVLDSASEAEEDKLEESAYKYADYHANDVVTVAFGAGTEPGEFSVTVKVGETGEPIESTFTNIGGNYSEYRNDSAATPELPLSFTAHLPEGTAADTKQLVHMRSLNGQTFELNEDGDVVDNAKPVLVIDESVYAFRLGQRFSLTYTAMDVCKDSVDTSRRYYYMLKKDEDGNFVKPDLSTSSNDYKSLSTSTYFMPTADTTENEEAYVSIRFRLDDGTFTDHFVYLTWYADDSAVEKMGNEGVSKLTGYTCNICKYECTVEEYEDLTAEGKDFKCPGKVDDADCTAAVTDYKEKNETNYFDYIKVNLEAEGPAYLGVEKVEETTDGGNTVLAHNDDTAAQAIWEKYREELAAAADKVSAGDGAYLYLPSLRGLIASNYADYRNLRFSIYYYKPGTSSGGSASSATSLRYNNLRIEVEEKGEYRFRVIAQDAAGNAMKYYDKDGKLVTLTSSNVWDVEGIPEFHFIAGYTGPVVEEKDTQTPGRREKTYTIPSFDIIALSGYKTEYKLYRYDDSAEDALTYEQLVKKLKGATEIDADLREKLITIEKFNHDVDEDDPEWEKTNNDYAWDPDSSLTFCPQVVGYYVVEVVVTDAKIIGLSTTAYQVIEIEEVTDTIKGQSQWLKNNLTSVILFSIAGVLFIALVVVFVIKPSDQSVEEVDLDSLKGKKNKKE